MDEENKKKNNKTNFSAKDFSEFIKTPKGKALLFFGIYLIFFVCLSIFSHVGERLPVLGSTDLNLDQPKYNIEAIKDDNYSFSYQYNVDGNIYNYHGEEMNHKARFSDGVTNYYKSSDIFMREQDGIWIKCDAPYMLPRITESSVIEELLNKATYISKTELASGEESYNLQISTPTLAKVLDGEDIDIDDPVNTILLKENSDGDTYEIQYDFSDYAKYKGLVSNNLNITLSYSDFGQIENVEEPA